MLDQWLQIEEAARLWETQIRGVHLWPLVRYSVLRSADDALRGHTPAAPAGSRQRFLQPATLVQLGRLATTLRSKRTCTGLFFTTQRNWETQATGVANDRLYEPLMREGGKPWVFHSPAPGTPASTDRLPWKCFREESLDLLSVTKGALRPLAASEKRLAQRFLEQVALAFPGVSLAAGMDRVMLRLVQRALALKAELASLQGRVSPAVAIVHAACYLGPKAVLTWALKHAGLRVVEFQHGFIGREHLAYNYPASVLEQDNHPARAYLPDDFLSFGPYWSASIRLPGKVTDLGYPFLERRAATLQNRTLEPRSVLVISQGTVTAKLVELARGLAQAEPGRTIHFKLHPTEHAFSERYEPLRSLGNVNIITQGDVYEWLARCPVVVGYDSTALFEALMFGSRRIFFLENRNVPADLGQPVRNVEELQVWSQDPSRGVPRLDKNDLWRPQSLPRLLQWWRGL